VAPLRPLAAAFVLLALAACGEATGTSGSSSTSTSSSPPAIGGGDTATAAPPATPTPAATAPPTPRPTAAPTANIGGAVRATPTANTCGAPPNPWGYGFCSGSTITGPPSTFCDYFDCISSFWNGRGYVEECQDTRYSKSGGIRGSCSQHGGNLRPLLRP
jgi:hypothetical protein